MGGYALGGYAFEMGGYAFEIHQQEVLILLISVLLLLASWMVLRHRRRKNALMTEMKWQELVAQAPETAEQARDAMRETLAYFHHSNDFRAIFLFGYFVITRNVCDAIRRTVSGEERVFLDPEWVRHLSGRFATLYFRSLREPDCARAWRIAHASASSRSLSPLQDLLLGINAHINFDLPIAIHQNLLAFGDLQGDLGLWRRKFDHDQVNNILLASVPELVSKLPGLYGGGVRTFRRALFNLDHSLLDTGLGYFRERVWWHAITLCSARDAAEREVVIRKLETESWLVASRINNTDKMVSRLLYRIDQVTRRRTLRLLSSSVLEARHA